MAVATSRLRYVGADRRPEPAPVGLAIRAGSLPAVCWYLLFFLGPLGIMGPTASRRPPATDDFAFTWTLDNLRYLWDPLWNFPR